MNRREFMNQLERLLGDISDSERREALDYYNSYFDDAGAENESKVIQELGSPGKVAAIIKADLASDSREYGEYTEQGYRDSRLEDDQMPQVYSAQDGGNSGQSGQGSRAERGYQVPPKKNNVGNLILIIAIVVMACIVGAPILAGIFGVLIGIVFAIFGIVLAAGIGAVALVVSGVAIAAVGITKCFVNPAVGFIVIAAGMACLAVGVLLAILFAWIGVKFIPWMIRGVVSLCQEILSKVRRKGGVTV